MGLCVHSLGEVPADAERAYYVYLLDYGIPYGDPELEMLYSYGRFLLPHLPLDREIITVKLGDEVELQLPAGAVHAGPIDLKQGDAQVVKSPTEVGTGEAKDEKAPLSEIIEVLNERFGTQFTEEDRLFFQQIKEKAVKNEQVIQTALANPLDKFELGIRKLIEDFMIERMGENDKIVTRYMADRDFQASAYPILAREIFDAVQVMNPDSYSFIAYCPQCKEKRGVSCSRADIRSGRPMQVYAVACDHSWTLSPKDSQKLRENPAILT